MAQSNVTPPRGMRDLLPVDKELREAALATIRRQYALYGYQEVETPALEELPRLLASDGGENEKLIFRVLKRNLAAEPLDPATLADLGLRFDLTVPLARFYATNRGTLPSVFRSLQIGPVWRAERPQKGRFRQFIQCDLDIIGEPGILAEIELITATMSTLRALGIEGAVVRLNDRRTLRQLLDTCGFPEPDQGRVLIILDKLDKISLEGVERELEAAGCAPDSIAALAECLRRPATILDNATELHAIADAVRELLGPDSVRLDLTLVRGMGYYTGPIFEVEHPASGNSIAGGGRYNGMIGRFLNESVPACGFSIGFERIVELVKLSNASSPARLALVYDASVAPGPLVKAQRDLVAKGYAVRLVRAAKKMGKLLETLKGEGFAHFVALRADAPNGADPEIRDLA